jgi:hypothetical protein
VSWRWAHADYFRLAAGLVIAAWTGFLAIRWVARGFVQDSSQRGVGAREVNEFSDEELRKLIEGAGGLVSQARAIGYPILALKSEIVAEAEAANRLTKRIEWLTLVGVLVAIVGVCVAVLPIVHSVCR